MSHLPGLACLNFPNMIQPLAEKLPPSLRGKWEKEIARHAENNAGAYPNFEKFSKVIQDQAKLKNNPNILAGKKSLGPTTSSPSSQGRVHRKTLKTDARLAASKPVPPQRAEFTKAKFCQFYERSGHDLTECKSFGAKSLDERTEWIKNAGLCFLCLSEGHTASNCVKKVHCTICGDHRHVALLHKEKDQNNEETVSPKMHRGVQCKRRCVLQ